MPLAEARYDVVLRHGDRLVPAVIDMIETRDVAADGRPGKLRAARMVRYDAPEPVVYHWLWIDRRLRPCLEFKGQVQQGVEWDRRYLRWIE